MSKRFMLVLTLTLVLIVMSLTGTTVQARSEEFPSLTEAGSYGVRVASMTFVDKQRTDWTLKVLVWYPADKTKGTVVSSGSLLLKNAPPDMTGAPYPLIIFSSGWIRDNAPANLPKVIEQMASQGYVVAAIQHHDNAPLRFELVNRPLDILLTLDGLAANKEGILAGMIDTNNVGLMGYSLGAETVLQMLGLLRDPVHFTSWCADHPELKSLDCIVPKNIGQWPLKEITDYRTQLGLENTPDGVWAPFGDKRIHAVLAIAPGDFPLTTDEMLAAVTTPTMILGCSDDPLNDYEGNAVRTYAKLGTDSRYLVSLLNVNKVAFYEWQDVPQHFATAFFGLHLKGDKIYAPYLTGEHLPAWKIPKLVWGVAETQ